MHRVELIVEPHEYKLRLEDFLCDRFRRISRMHLRELIRDEKCEVNGRFENAGKRLKPNDFVEIDIDLTREHSMLPQDIPIDIVYEDLSLIVVNKAAGMLVHPTHRDKNGTLLNALSFYLNRTSGEVFIRPGLIHRLDKETSGLMVIAKDSRSHRLLSSQFHRKTVEKKYIALVEGKIEEDENTIDLPIGRFAQEKRWGLKDDGKPSVTNLKVVERHSDTTLVELEPVTGRTNQLRIHCASIGHPIVGDVQRGGRAFERLCLHAFFLKFRHPTSQTPMECSSALPDEFSFPAQTP
jgi:23S rRNA pseudouridine1911/1915/1917 synthase